MNQDSILPDPPARQPDPVTQDEPKPSKGMSVSGFARNALHDAYDQLKGIYQLFPTVAGEAVKVAKGYKELPKISVENVAQGFEENLKGAGKGVIEPYQKYGARVAYEKPVTFATDALAVFSMITKSAGIAGRLAGGVVKAAPITLADKVVTMAKTIEELPSNLVRKGVDKGVMKLTGGKVDLAKRRDFLALNAVEQSQVPERIRLDMETVGKQVKALDDGEAELLHRWRTQGATVKELASNPKVANALDAWGKTVGEYQEILKKRGLLSDAQIEEVLAKKYAAEVFGDLGEDTLAKAREAVRAAEVKPIYGPAIFEKKGMTLDDYVDEVLNAQNKKPGAGVGFLEEYKGKAGAITDPREYIPKHIATFRNVEGKLRFRDRLLQSPELTGAPKGVKPLEGPAPGDISKTYYQDRMRWEQASQKFTDPTVKRLLQLEATRPQGAFKTVLRVYDKFLKAFRTSATVLNPRWYTGNAVGDAILGTLAGADWREAERLLKAKIMPPQVLSRGGVTGEISGVGGVLEKASEIGNFADQATKAGIVVREVGRRIKETGISAEASMEAMESVLKSTQAFSDVQVEMQLLQEQIARSSDKVRRLDAAINRTARAEAVLSKTAGTTAPRTLRHFTSEDVARSLKAGSPFDVTKKTLVGEPKAAGDRIYLSLADDDWMGYLSQSGKKLAPVEFHISPKARVLVIDSEQALQSARKLMPRGDIFTGTKEWFDELTKHYDIVEFRSTQSIPNRYVRSLEYDQAIVLNKDAVDMARSGKSKFNVASENIEILRQRVENLTAARDAIVKDIADDMTKNGALDARIPGLRQQNAIVQGAVDRANAFLGDYLGMDAFERGVMRRLIPFYTWGKAMNMLAFRLPFLAPVKGFMWNRYAEAMQEMLGDHEMPEWARGSIPLFARENGDMILKLSSYSPFSGLRVSKVGEVPVPAMLNIFESSPLFSLMFKIHGGKTIFDKGTLPHAGENLVFIGDGTGYEVTPNGKLEKTITQAPMLSSIAHSFPVVQYLEEAILPYKVNKYGWHGLPTPTYNADGTYRYPRELWQRLWGMAGVNLDVRSRESMIRSKKMMEKEFVDNAKKAFGRTQDPDERALIKESIRDYFRSNR